MSGTKITLASLLTITLLHTACVSETPSTQTTDGQLARRQWDTSKDVEPRTTSSEVPKHPQTPDSPKTPNTPYAWAQDTMCQEHIDPRAQPGQQCCATFDEDACEPGYACAAGKGYDVPVCLKIKQYRRGGAVCRMDEMCNSNHCDFGAGDGQSVGLCRADVGEPCETDACADGLRCVLNDTKRLFECWPDL